MVVYTHWGGTGNGEAGVDRGVYRLLKEYDHTGHCNSSYHGLVSGSGAEYGTVHIHEMVKAARPGHPGDKGKACSRGGGGNRLSCKNKRER